MSATTLADAVGRRVGDRRSTVVDRRRLEDDAERTDSTGRCEQPQKQPVQYQRYVLPVFFDLRRRTTHSQDETLTSDMYNLKYTLEIFNPLESGGNYSATSNNIKLAHWH